MRENQARKPAATPDELCAEICARQHGVIERTQALGVGLTPRAITNRLQRHLWYVLYPTVYRDAGAPQTWRQRLVGACLWAGHESAAGRRSAAALWHLDGVEEGAVEVLAIKDKRHSGVTAFRPSGVLCGDVTTVDAIPTTRVSRTLVDLSGVLPAPDLEIVLDSALRQGLTSVDYLFKRIRAGERATRGSKRLLELLLERQDDQGITESALETRLRALLRRSPLPMPVAQYEIRHRGVFIARADFAYPDQHVAIECEGYRYHHGKRRWHIDLERRNRLALLGWHVVHVTFWDLRYRPSYVMETIAGALGMTLAL